MKTSKDGLDFIKGFESFVPYVYDDLVPPVKGKYKEWKGGACKGTLTIGYGHTNAAKHPLKITKGLRISEDEACDVLAVDLSDCEEAVKKLVKKPLTQGQWDACVSFTFNCGAGNFKNIAARINRGDYQAARAAFDLYTKSKGVTLRGLQRRRDGEQALWDSATPAVIEAEDTFHPAEVDEPDIPVPADSPAPSEPDSVETESEKSPGLIKFEIIQDLYANSKKWLWLRWQKITGGGSAALGLASLGEDQHIPVWVFIVALIVLGLLIWFFASKVQGHMVKDSKEGRYVPSGKANA